MHMSCHGISWSMATKPTTGCFHNTFRKLGEFQFFSMNNEKKKKLGKEQRNCFGRWLSCATTFFIHNKKNTQRQMKTKKKKNNGCNKKLSPKHNDYKLSCKLVWFFIYQWYFNIRSSHFEIQFMFIYRYDVNCVLHIINKFIP